MPQVLAGLFVQFFHLMGLWKQGRVIDREAGCFADLAQDEEHILLAGQRSQQGAFRQRLEFLWGYAEPVD